MSRLIPTLFLLLLPIVAQADDEKMLFVEYRLTGKQIAADSFDAQPKKVWRIGLEYLRFEDAPNPQTKIHGLIIVAEPDIWIVDRNTNKSEHTVDPGPVLKAHFPLFPSEKSKKLGELEFGHELEYFRKNAATELPAQGVDGVKCRVLRLTVDDREITLYLKANDIPLQIVMKSAEREYTMRFLRYQPDLQPDKSLFQLSSGTR